MKKLIYFHGLSSSGQSSTPKYLRQLLPDWEIISPDIPVHPQEALPYLRQLCKELQPDFIIGTSMGGMYAQQMHGYRRILINPAFHVSETLRKNLGTQTFFSPRKDGATSFDISPELCDAFEEMEKKQFLHILPIDKSITLGLFGTKDEVVNCQDEYLQHYSYADTFEGGHRLSYDILKDVVLKWMDAFERWGFLRNQDRESGWMHQRFMDAWSYKISNHIPFTSDECRHFLKLNTKLIELTIQVYNRVHRITKHLQQEIANGNHDYDDFTVEGYIYIEVDDKRDDNLQTSLIGLCDKYTVIIANNFSTLAEMDGEMNSYLNWWSNWDGMFKELTTEHNIPVCKAFKFLFDDLEVFTIKDILKISSSQLKTSIRIYL